MRIQQFDLFPKFSDDVREQTYSGGILAIISFLIMIILFILRFQSWASAPPKQQFIVSKTILPLKGSILDPEHLPKMDINFDIFMYHLPCSYLHIDVLDVIKEEDETYQGRVKYQRFSPNGDPILSKPFPKEEEPPPADYCGPCYMMKSGCCNTCKEVRKAFKAKRRPLPPIATIEQCAREGYIDELRKMINESCRVYGSLTVHRHPGIFHIAPGDDTDPDGRAYEKIGVNMETINMSHTINQFSMGIVENSNSFLPLNGHHEIQIKDGRLKMLYFIRAVPLGIDGRKFSISSTWYQNYRSNSSKKFPGVFFQYDISPISVITSDKPSVIIFLTEVAAILGGVFSIATFVDQILYRIIPDNDSLSTIY